MSRLLGRSQSLNRKEERVLELISDHYDLVVKTVQQLEPLFEAAKTDNRTQIQVITNKISEFERVAYAFHRDAVLAISKGGFFPGIRTGFLELMEENDEVADATQNASRILAESAIPSQSFLLLYEGTEATLEEFLSSIQTAVMGVQESLRALDRETELAVEQSLLVERAEEDADEVKNLLLKHLMAHKSDLDLFTLIQLRDFVLKLYDIAVASEKSSDLVISLVARA